MFRNILKEVIPKSRAIIILKNGITVESYKVPTEINAVKLIGTIANNIERQPNGAIQLYIKTLKINGFCVHKVTIANSALLKMVENRLEQNQRIRICGRLKSENRYVESKRYQYVEIMATSLHLLEAEPMITPNLKELYKFDQNFIEIMGFLGTEVYNEKILSAFSLKTHFLTKKGKPDELMMNEYHKVLLVDPNNGHLMNKARLLQKNDRVYIKGSVEYSTKEYPNGEVYASGYIRPSGFIKLKKFNT